MCRLVNVKTNFNTEIEVADIKKEVVENIIEAAGVCCYSLVYLNQNPQFFFK